MNLSKQNKILKKQNEKLLKEIKSINFEFKELKNINSESEKRAKDLIQRLDKIKSDWENMIEELEVQRNKYNDLIDDIQKCRNGMVRRSNSFFKRFLRK